MDSFDAFCDDFFCNLDLQTSLPLPSSRETILQFCEACQRQYPDMATFYQRESGEFILEGDREGGSYRWIELDSRRLSAGYFNPPNVAEAIAQHQWILDRCTYFLGVSHLDVDCMDFVFGFNLDFQGNRDAIVSQALLSGSPLGCLTEDDELIPLGFEPSCIVSIDRECYQQARLSLETRCNSYQVRTGNYDEEPISIYFTIRGYPVPGKKFDMQEALASQAERACELTGRIVLPKIVQPIAEAIAANP